MAGLGLVLDLSQTGWTAALDESGATRLSGLERSAGARHDDVADWVANCLAQAGGGFADLRWICVGLGPGSFTGIRIAMAFAQGLALPRGIPVHGFTAFEALFLSSPEAVNSTAVIPANSGRAYVSRGLSDPGALTDAAALERMAGESVLSVPARYDAVAIARHARASGRGADRPYYLQVSAAEEKAALG